MLNVLGKSISNEFLEEIHAKFKIIDDNKEMLDKLTRENDKIMNELQYAKNELLNVLTVQLDAIKHRKFLTLSEFLYPEKMYPALQGKSIADDFIFLFYDSLKKIHILYPHEITALFIYKQVKTVDAANFRQFSEDTIRKDIEKIIAATKKYNWIVQLEKADSLHIVRKDGILIIPTFIYLFNGRKTHSKMKINNVLVFRRTEETKQLFKTRDLILTIMQLK